VTGLKSSHQRLRWYHMIIYLLRTLTHRPTHMQRTWVLVLFHFPFSKSWVLGLTLASTLCQVFSMLSAISHSLAITCLFVLALLSHLSNTWHDVMRGCGEKGSLFRRYSRVFTTSIWAVSCLWCWLKIYI